MKVLWLAPIAISKDRVVKMPPWIGTLAKALTEEAGIELTILNYDPRLDQSLVTTKTGKIQCVFLKTPVPKKDFLSLYSQRIRIINNHIKKREADFDLIHVHGTEHQYESSLNGVKLPAILSMQGVMAECIKALPKILSYTYLSWKMAAIFEKINITKLHNFMCRTHFDKAFVKRHNPKAKIFDVWEMIRPVFFETFEISNQSDTLLFAGGSHPIKGLDLCLAALNDLHMRGKITFTLKVIGNVKTGEVERIIRKNRLEYIQPHHIDILGFVDDREIAEIYQTVFALIHPSKVDNSPNTVCEAQVAGLPVIASDIGGLRSLITHYETGILTSLHPEAIANEILKLKLNNELWKKISVNAMGIARAKHDKDKILTSTLAIYEGMLINKKNATAFSPIPTV